LGSTLAGATMAQDHARNIPKPPVTCNAPQERLPGGYSSGGGGSPTGNSSPKSSPSGSPTAEGRYAGAEGVSFGDVEEDEGASGNPGLADLQAGEGDGQVPLLSSTPLKPQVSSLPGGQSAVLKSVACTVWLTARSFPKAVHLAPPLPEACRRWPAGVRFWFPLDPIQCQYDRIQCQ